MKYLPLYEKWMESGKIPTWGLCSFFEKDELFKLIDPENGKGITYWGFPEASMCQFDYYPDFLERQHYEFTPLRQTVVLLMAAMNNEL